MIVHIPANKHFNEQTLFKDQDFELLQGFISAVANKGMPIKEQTRLVVDFRSRPGTIMVSSYPPPMWTRAMRTMHVGKLYDKQWIAYREQLKRYKKGGGMKMRSQNPLTGEVTTEKLFKTPNVKVTKSGIIIQQ